MAISFKVFFMQNLNEIKFFFDHFPFKVREERRTIDLQHFFNKLIPKILLGKENDAISPPELNVFEGFNLGSDEVKHCSILAWFLNPRANHCQGSLFLKALLTSLHQDSVYEPIIKYAEDSYYSVSTEDDFATQGRVDINIFSKDFWLIIEVKIAASLQSEQLNRYNDIFLHKATPLGISLNNCKLLFLTVDGGDPKEGHADLCLSWIDIANVLEQFSFECKNAFTSSIATQYAHFLKNYIGRLK